MKKLMTGENLKTPKTITVYTTDYCPFCINAKMLLQRLNLPFTEVNLENNHELRARLSRENNGWRTVPMIFIGDHFVGGFTELKSLHDRNELQSLL